MKKENQDNIQESWEEKLKDLISRAFNIGIGVQLPYPCNVNLIAFPFSFTI